MTFIKKIFDGLKTNHQESYSNTACKELTLTEANEKIIRANNLANILNKTTDREEFYNSLKEIKEILRELAKYEDKLPFSGSPSDDLRKLEQSEQRQIQLLEIRIAQKNNSYSDNNIKNIDCKYFMLAGFDTKFVEAGYFVIQQGLASTALLQRYFKIGYCRAMKIIEELECMGVVACNTEYTDRKVLTKKDEFKKKLEYYSTDRKVLMTKDEFEKQLEYCSTHPEQIFSLKRKEHLNQIFDSEEILLREKYGIITDYTNDVECLKKLKNILVPSVSNDIQTEFINMLLKYNSPEKMKLILIDDSVINYSKYNGLSHLLIPVVTDTNKFNTLISYCKSEIEARIRLFVEYGVQNIDSFNDKMEETGESNLPRIICVVNEANEIFGIIDSSLSRMFMNSNTVGIYFIFFSRFSLKRLSPGIIGELLEIYNSGKLQMLLPQNNITNGESTIKNFDDLDGHQFERFCADVLIKNGFRNVEVTQDSCDHGIDILAEKDDITYAIQCKCYSSDIGNAAVQQAHTGKSLYHKDIAVVMSNRYFTGQAIEEAKELGVKLWNRDKLNEMIESINDNSQ